MTKKQVALVTGGGRGIGRGIAQGLAAAGWSVAVNYRSNVAAATETVEAIWQAGGGAVPVQADISKAEDRTRLIEFVLREYGRIDVLVNNAGMTARRPTDLLDIREDSYDEIMDVNLKGPLFLTQQVARTMIRQLEEGVIAAPGIVNIGSISAYTSSPERSEYCLSKAGLSMMTLLFADRLAEYGIHVYEVRPGIIETDLTGRIKAQYDELIADGLTPIKRWGQPEDIAKAVVALARGDFPFSTGQVINVDGGFHFHRL